MCYSEDFRLIALKLYYNNKNSISEIIKNFKINRKTFYNWRLLYGHLIINENTTKKDLMEITINKTNKNPNRILTDDIKNYISDNIINNPYFNAKKFVRKLCKKFKIIISKSTFYNWLKYMNISYKRARRKIHTNINNITQKKKEVKQKLDKIKQNKQTLYSLDEFGINIEDTPNYGYNYKGKKVDFKVSKIKGIHYSVLVCISKSKIIGYVIKKGAITGDDYINFFKKYINPNKRCHILMDNATIHKTKKFTAYIKKTQNKALYNAPYNPEGNPVEHLNNKVKCFIKSKNINTENMLMIAINNGFKTITSKNLEAFYNCSLNTF
jgi:transposase